MDSEELDACYERIGAIRCFVRKPRLLDAGNEIRFYVPGDDPDADTALALGATRYHDCQVLVTVHLVKDANGADLKRKTAEKSGRPYGHLAQILYSKGFFNAPQVQREIGAPAEGISGQSAWGRSLAVQIGYESMGFVPPPVLLQWAQQHSVDWMLPREYTDEEEG